MFFKEVAKNLFPVSISRGICPRVFFFVVQCGAGIFNARCGLRLKSADSVHELLASLGQPSVFG